MKEGDEGLYSKRFAQSAGPGFRSSKICTVPIIFLPNMLKKQNGMLAFWGALFESFFHLRGIFLSNFRPLEALWGSYGLIFGVKKWFGHQTCPKIAPRSVFPVSGSPFWRSFGVIFSYFLYFSPKKKASEICSFFSSIFGSPELSTGRAHMQSVHAGAVQTHFFSFALFLKSSSQQTSCRVHFGGNFH